MLKLIVIFILALSAFAALNYFSSEWTMKVIGSLTIALVSLIFERFSPDWVVSNNQYIMTNQSIIRQPTAPLNLPVPFTTQPQTPNCPTLPNPTVNDQNDAVGRSLLIDDDVEDVNNNRTPIKNSDLKPSIYRLGMCIT